MFKKRHEMQTEIKRLQAVDKANQHLAGQLVAERESVKLHKDKIELLTSKSVIVEKERDKLRKMVRKQNGADLLVNALEAVGMISKPVTQGMKDETLRRAADLENVRRQMSSAQGLGTGFYGTGGGGSGLLGL